MDPKQMVALLESKLEEHGLKEEGWRGEVDGAVRRFGTCNSREKRITVSSHLAAINSDDEVLDTILHEIAHALAFAEHGEDCGHDGRWKAIAARVGARPERCFDGSKGNTVAGAYALVHRDTGEVFRTYHRRPKVRDFSNHWIRGRKADTEGKLVLVSTREHNRIVGHVGSEEGAATAGDSIRSFDRYAVTRLSEKITAAIENLCREAGLTVILEGGRFDPETYRCTYAIRVPEYDVEEEERAEFALHCHLFGLTAEAFGRELEWKGRIFNLCGLKPRNRKYPVIGRNAGGRRFKFPASVLDQLRS